MEKLLDELEITVKNLIKVDYERPNVTAEYSIMLVQIEKMKLTLHSEINKKIVKFTYKNYRGETRVRTVLPIDLCFGTSPYHEGEQWFLEGIDQDKKVTREFPMKDIKDWCE